MQLRNRFATVQTIAERKDFDKKIDDCLFELAYDGKAYQPRPDYYKWID